MPFSAPGETAGFTGDKTITGSLTVTGGITQPGGPVDVRAFGAVGDGVADDTAAIQAAIDSYDGGGPVYLPKGEYRITTQLVCRLNTQLIGASRGHFDEPQYGTYIDAQASVGGSAISVPSSSRNVIIRNLNLRGYSLDGGLGYGIYAHAAAALHIENLGSNGFAYGVYLESCQDVSITGSHITNAGQIGLGLHDCHIVHVLGSTFANSGRDLLASGANVKLTGGTSAVVFDAALQDETDCNGFWFQACYAVTFRCPILYLARAGYALRVGPTSTNITIYDTYIMPFSGDRVPLNTIRIEAGATGVRLINVGTVPNGGGDIDDQGTDTLWLNVNGKTKHPVVATASLPAAATAENGRLIVEDGGAGNGNLVLYVGGSRYRIDGGTAF